MSTAKKIVNEVQDPFTGQSVSPYLGGDPIEDAAPASPADRGDDPAAPPATPPAAQPADPLPQDPPPQDPPPQDPPADPPPQDPPASPPQDPPRERPPIPYDRFKEVNDKKKAAEAEAEQLRAKLAAFEKGQPPAPTPAAPTPPAYDFAAKEEEYGQLLLDGRTQDAAKLRAEINGELVKQITTEVTTKATQQTAATISQADVTKSIDALANDFSIKYPALDDASPDYNDEAVEQAKVLYAGYTGVRGMDPVSAFKKAVQDVVKLYDLKDASAPPPAPAPAPTPPPAPRKPVKEAVAAAAAQPPATVGTGSANGTAGVNHIEVNNLTDEQFDALPAATKARLRGDFLGA